MEFEVKRAFAEDGDAIADVIQKVWEQVEEKEWFVADDGEWIKGILKSGDGVAYKAVEKESGDLAGVFVAVFPGLGEDNLGRDMGLEEMELLKVAHMDSVAISLEYRGHGLQYKMMMEGEREIGKLGYEYLMCTVYPDNRFSRDNILRQGYEVVATKEKYGGYLRDIMLKRLKE